MPMIAFSGVRSSWLTRAKNSLLASLAASAASLSCRSRSRSLRSVTSVQVPIHSRTDPSGLTIGTPRQAKQRWSPADERSRHSASNKCCSLRPPAAHAPGRPAGPRGGPRRASRSRAPVRRSVRCSAATRASRPPPRPPGWFATSAATPPRCTGGSPPPARAGCSACCASDRPIWLKSTMSWAISFGPLTRSTSNRPASRWPAALRSWSIGPRHAPARRPGDHQRRQGRHHQGDVDRPAALPRLPLRLLGVGLARVAPPRR